MHFVIAQTGPEFGRRKLESVEKEDKPDPYIGDGLKRNYFRSLWQQPGQEDGEKQGRDEPVELQLCFYFDVIGLHDMQMFF